VDTPATLDRKQEAKVAWITNNMAQSFPTTPDKVLHAEQLAAIHWESSHTDDDVMHLRETLLSHLETVGDAFLRDGSVTRWRTSCDSAIQRITADVNGPLFQHLLRQTGYHDAAVVDLFSAGAPLVGPLPTSGNGAPKADPCSMSTEQLAASCLVDNRAILGSIREDANADKLLELTQADAALGRMTAPAPIETVDLAAVRLTPRFSVVQGPKVRPIDDCSRSSVNAAVEPGEKLSVEGADSLVSALRAYRELNGDDIGLWKADIDSAYRRIPVAPSHRWTVVSIFMCLGTIMASTHLSLPFGAVASVHAWDRVGSALAHLARVLLRLPTLRYVDDFFCCCRRALQEFNMNCFARLVRLLLGSSAISAKKLAFGVPLVILGLVVIPSPEGILLYPSPDKVAKWSLQISTALAERHLCAGLASKLSGALQWATSHMFLRLGRAMLRPLYMQSKAKHSRMSPALHDALVWWQEVLDLGIAHSAPWVSGPASTPGHLYCDARSTPARLAAVLIIDGRVLYVDREPTVEELALLDSREDLQIMGLELLAIALGLATFVDELTNRDVVVWSDNVGAEGAVRSGSARAWDHSRIVHCIWLAIARTCTRAWFERVPTDDNVADDPSREQYELLRLIGGQRCEPRLEASFWRLSLASASKNARGAS
jgi:hypothetical protein